MTHSVLRPTIALMVLTSVRTPSELVNVDFAIIRKLESASFVVITKGILVDLGIFGQFTVGLDTFRSGNSHALTLGKRTFKFRASSAVYLTITSALPSWKSRSERRMISP